MSIPSKRLCTRVACEVGWPLLLLLLLLPVPLSLFDVVLGVVEGVAEDAREPTLLDTVNREWDGRCQRDREHGAAEGDISSEKNLRVVHWLGRDSQSSWGSWEGASEGRLASSRSSCSSSSTILFSK